MANVGTGKCGDRLYIYPHALVKSFEITCDKPMFLQVDGEAASSGDNRHYKFDIISNGINLIFPEPKPQSVPIASGQA